MKIAAVSENGTTISQHFGRAPMYVVMTVENGKIVGREKRLRSALGVCSCHDGAGSNCHDVNHASDTASLVKHTNMADAISDCQVVIAGGMGYGAYAALRSRNLEPIITDKENIDEAMGLFLNGNLENLMENLH